VIIIGEAANSLPAEVRSRHSDVAWRVIGMRLAGIICMGSVGETEIAAWRAVFDTNVFGAVRCIRAVLPLLRPRGGGCIVNVSSAAGVVALSAVSAYAASKAALEMLSQAVAIEAGPHGIRVVLVEAGSWTRP